MNDEPRQPVKIDQTQFEQITVSIKRTNENIEVVKKQFKNDNRKKEV